MKRIDIHKDILHDSFYDNLCKSDFTLEILLSSSTNVIGESHIKKFSAFINRFKKSAANNIKGDIKLIFSKEIINFDITLIGIITLFKETYKNIEFEITLPQYAPTEVFLRFRDVLLGLRNWYSDLTGNILFRIKDEQNFDLEKVREPEGILPIILITADSFNDFFIKNNTNNEFRGFFSKELYNEIRDELNHNISLSYTSSTSFADKNYKAVRDTLKRFDNLVDWKNNHRLFFQHYIKMIAEFDLLQEQINFLNDKQHNIKLEAFRKKGLKDIEIPKFKKSVKEVIFKLKAHPPYLTLIFSILVVRNLDRIIENVDDYIKRLNELFEFSRNMFFGIREIARNIVEHTESKKGILLGRVYNGEALKNIRRNAEDESQMIDSYFKHLLEKGYLTKELEKEYFLDIIIFDEGEKGIIPKSIENITTLLGGEGDSKNLYLEDISMLESGAITFSDFYNPIEIKLNHHAIKASSHWGLIIFTNLINKNYGLFLVSSYSGIVNEYDCCYKFDDTIKVPKYNIAFELGCYYNIVLPLDKTFNLKEEYIPNTIPKESNFSEKNFKELLSYRYIQTFEEIDGDGHNNLFQIKVQDFIKNKEINEYRFENEIAKSIANQLKKLNVKQSKIIPVLDFDGCESFFDQSKLVRFLAQLEIGLDIYSIVIVNLIQDTVKDLFKTLTCVFSSTTEEHVLRKNFWNKEHFILIYSFEVNERGNRLYFADIIGGYTFSDFFSLNYKLSSTHFTYKKFPISNIKEFTSETIDSLTTSPIYISESGVVQNFELIIEHKDKTLFEHSIEFILNEEI